MMGAARAATTGIAPVFRPPMPRAARPPPAAIIGPVAPPAAARASPSWANIDAARIGAEPEFAVDSGTGAELSDSLGRRELAMMRTIRPSKTTATRKP